MTIQYASDLHVEFPMNSHYLRKHPLEAAADVLVLAGDVMPLSLIERNEAFFDDLSARWDLVLWLPGNHEYYGNDLGKFQEPFNLAVRDNIYLINDSGVKVGDGLLLFSTLWSHISPLNQSHVRRGLSDFRNIKYRGSPLTPDRYNEMHRISLSRLKDLLATDHAGPVVVVTHHVPTFMHYPAQYKGDALNEAFASEQFDLIEACGAAAWIYGHHHRNTPEYTIGTTRMLTNQLGYVQMDEHGSFVRDRVLRVDKY